MYLYICYIFGTFGIIIIQGDLTCFLVIHNFISSIFIYKVLLATEGLQYSHCTLESEGFLLSADPAFTFSIHLASTGTMKPHGNHNSSFLPPA